MNYVELVTIIFHTVCDSLGMLFNMALLYLVLFRTPSRIAVYSILIGNAALTDFVACLAACLIQQRIVPIKTSLVYFSHGPCQAIGAEFCYLIYYILKKQQPSPRLLKFLIAIVSLPSCFQLIIMCFANEPTATLIPILEQELPHYVIEKETISGHTNVFEWKTFTAILHMTVPIVPVYVCILILRKRIITMLSTRYMSENTKILHKQLLKALTYQAMLPGLFFFGVLSYACGQIGFYHHPLLESLTLISLGTFPILSPLISMYFIGPYRKSVSAFLIGLFPKKTSPATRDDIMKYITTVGGKAT
ncbi:hypothetical protein V3C99_007033, partial [Haemonchus contortus]